jgi:hypothetical protein
MQDIFVWGAHGTSLRDPGWSGTLRTRESKCNEIANDRRCDSPCARAMIRMSWEMGDPLQPRSRIRTGRSTGGTSARPRRGSP